MAVVFIAPTIKSKPNKSCGNCTKCCDGWLSGKVNGVPKYPGKPCYLVKTGIGCSDYDNRPDEPCRQFICEWLDDSNVPLSMKPSEINCIIVKSEIGQFEFFKLAPAGSEISQETILWAKSYYVDNGKNLWWYLEGINYLDGSKEFVDYVRSMGYN